MPKSGYSPKQLQKEIERRKDAAAGMAGRKGHILGYWQSTSEGWTATCLKKECEGYLVLTGPRLGTAAGTALYDPCPHRPNKSQF